MRGRKMSFRVEVTAEERAELERWQRSPKKESGLVRRGRVILMLADGATLKDVCAYCKLAPRIVRKWARRFIEERIPGLADRRRPGRKPLFSP